MVHDFKHGHIVGSLLARVELVLETALAIVGEEGELIAGAHNHCCVGGLEGLFGQVAALIVEQSVAISAPSDAFHQHNMSIEILRDSCTESCIFRDILDHGSKNFRGIRSKLWLVLPFGIVCFTGIYLVESV